MPEQNIPREVMKQMSAKELWQAKGYEEILDRMLESRANVYTDDYGYEPDDIIDDLGMKELIEDDEQLPKIRELGKGNENHYLVRLKKRELILQHLVPLLEQLPTYDFHPYPEETLGEGKFPINPDFDRHEVIHLINNLMWAGVCTAQGDGSKMVNINQQELDAIMAEGGEALSKKLSDSNERIDRVSSVLKNVRGEELTKLIQSIFESHKGHDLAHAKKQDIDVSIME